MRTRLIAAAFLLIAGIARAQVNGQNVVLVNGANQGGGGGVTDHALLTNLDYASALHTGFAPLANATFTGNTTVATFRLFDAGTHYSTFQAQTQIANITYTLPAADGAGALTSNGSGALSWAVPAGTGANTTLSNIGSVALSAALIPGADGSLALGSSALRFTTAYASTGFSIYKAASEANPTATLGNGVLNFGAGTTNAVDVGLKRSGAGVLYVTDGSSGQGDLNAHGLVIADTTVVTNLNSDTVDGSHAAAFANVALSNLASVAINAAVNPGADNGIAIGTSALRFTTISASTGFSIFKAASEANPTATLGNGVLNFGAGTSNAVDVGLKRSSGGVLYVTDGSSGAGDLNAHGLVIADTTMVTNLNADTVDGYHGTGLANINLSNIDSTAIPVNLETAPGVTAGLIATAPGEDTAAQAGVAAQIRASDAVAGTVDVGAEAGGSVYIWSGAAARLTSGDANGGDIILTPGAGIGTGSYGIARPSDDNILALGSSAYRLTTAYASTGFSIYKAISEANPTASLQSNALKLGAGGATASDAMLTRSAAGVITMSSTATASGTMSAGRLTAIPLATGATPTITQAGTPGSTQYQYAVRPMLADGTPSKMGSTANTNTGNATLSGTNYNIITFALTTGAAYYEIYRIYSAGTPATTGRIITTATTSPQNDTGLAKDIAVPSTTALSANQTGAFAFPSSTTFMADSPGNSGIVFGRTDSAIDLAALYAYGFYSYSTDGSVNLGGSTPTMRMVAGGGYLQASNMQVKWTDSTSSALSTLDTGLARSAAAVVKVTNGSTGNGSLVASTAITAVGTAAYNGVIRTGVYKRAWTNAEVVALGALDDAELKIATLPAKTVVRNAYVVVDTMETHLTDLTVALGRTGATYVDYTVASDADVSAESLGNELVTNGTFTGNATGWTLGAGGGEPDWHYADNNVHHVTGTATLTPSTPLVAVVGTQYKLQWTMAGYNLGTCTASFGGVTGTARSSDATFTEYFVATATTTLAFTPSSTFDGTVDTVTLKAVANTVYGDAVGERGTNLTGYDLPSYTATTDIYLNFVTTDGGHDLTNALQSAGTVYLMTETLP